MLKFDNIGFKILGIKKFLFCKEWLDRGIYFRLLIISSEAAHNFISTDVISNIRCFWHTECLWSC